MNVNDFDMVPTDSDWQDQLAGLEDHPDTESFPQEDNLNDVEADADTLASAGWGTDEDYGPWGDVDEFYGE